MIEDGKSSAEIAKRMDALQTYDLTEWAAEFIADAEKARAQAIAALQQLHAGAVAQEETAAKEAARIAAELDALMQRFDSASPEEQAKIREEARKKQTELDKIKAEGENQRNAGEQAGKNQKEHDDRQDKTTDAEAANISLATAATSITCCSPT